jgi:hypothetical protein
MQRQQLPTRDELGITSRVAWHLHVEEEPALAQDVGDIDDAGRFLVTGSEVPGGSLDEPIRVGSRDRGQGVRPDRVAPNHSQMVGSNQQRNARGKIWPRRLIVRLSNMRCPSLPSRSMEIVPPRSGAEPSSNRRRQSRLGPV